MKQPASQAQHSKTRSARKLLAVVTQPRPAASQPPYVTPQYVPAHCVPVNEPLCPITSFSKHHVDRSWSNAFAESNILKIDVTEQSRHDDRSWSNEPAARNMYDASSTRATSQLFRGWSNEAAPENIFFMDVTCDTSQPLISSLKLGALAWSWLHP